jgi:predicted flap endonuclease-1-like 5' DNA nuclease
MTVWTALILGLLLGWLVEWAIDWIYWRQRLQAEAAELANLRAQSARLRADIDAGAGSIDRLKADLEAANAGLAAATAANQRLQVDLEAADGSIAQYKSELSVLDSSISALQSERDRLRGDLEALRAGRAPADLGTAQDSGKQYKTQLLSADPALFEAGAGVQLGGAEPAGANEQIEPLAPESASSSLANAVGERRRDPLIDINGIGPVYAQRLLDAGIYTFEELAAQSPARLRELVGAKAWQEANTAAWIAEARRFAQADQRRSAR